MKYEAVLGYDKLDVFVEDKLLGMNVNGFVCYTIGEFYVPSIKFDVILVNHEAFPKEPFDILNYKAKMFVEGRQHVFEFEGIIAECTYNSEIGIAEAEIISKGQVYMDGKPFGN